MRLEGFIARRYLFSGQHKALVTFNTVISVGGVAVGVLALIVALAVMEGFGQNLKEKIMGAYSHIEIVRAHLEVPPLAAEPLLAQLAEQPEVLAAGPVVYRQCLLVVPGPDGASRQSGAFVQGIVPELERNITTLLNNVQGKAEPDAGEIVLGHALAAQLRVTLGDRLLIYSPSLVRGPTGPVPIVRNATIVGIFRTGFPETDQLFAYTSLESARRLFNVGDDDVDGVHLVIRDPDRVLEVAARLQQRLGTDVRVSTWIDRNPLLFDALKLEKWVMFIVLLLIVAVAAFNIIGTLVMVVMEKTREIGILKSMGVTEASIRRIFLLQGLWIGAVGTGTGAALGLLICYILQNHVKIDLLSEAYLTDRIPLQMNLSWNLLIVGASMFICLIASLYPARAAARLDPVEALRYE